MLWHCMGCTSRYAESLDACPHCGSGERVEAHRIDDDLPAEPAQES